MSLIKASHQKAMEYLREVTKELDRLGVEYRVNEQKKRIIINIPRFIPEEVKND